MANDNLFMLLEGNNALATTLYQSLIKNTENVLFSPITLHTVVTIMSQAPYYSSKNAFNTLLVSNDTKVLVECYKEIVSYFNSIKDLSVSMNGKAFIKENYKLQKLLATMLMNKFAYKIDSHFAQNELVTSEINTWIGEKTNRKIKNFLSLTDITDETHLLLTQAFHYTGKWTKPFDIQNTGIEKFYLNENNAIDIPMMKMTEQFLYTNDFDCEILKLPFSENDMSLIIILPNKERTLQEIENNFIFQNPVQFISNMIITEVKLSLPKFKLEHSLDFKHYLNEISTSEEEIDNYNYLFGMTDTEEFLFANKFPQSASLNVDENGCEAAAGVAAILEPNKINDDESFPKNGLVIYEMNVTASISNRFVKTLVISKVKNVEKFANNATFTVVLPDTAFITEFVMEIDGKTYKSEIKGKEEAKNIYKEAVSHGKSAGLVEAGTRNSNEFRISVNLEAESVGIFSLSYEEMLQRIHDRYELVVNIRPGQIINKLNIEVNINESRPLKFVKTPPIRSGFEMGGTNETYLDPLADIEIINKTTAKVKFSPDVKTQKKFAHFLRSHIANGLSAQFVVQYDVERDPLNGEILLQDGYFVHFFAPNDLDPLPKHVVFVLDTSTSMDGRKIIQLKDAMMSILNEIGENDAISIIEYNSRVIIWDINRKQSIDVDVSDNLEENHDENSSYKYHEKYFYKLNDVVLPNPVFSNQQTIGNAKNVVEKMKATGCTYMIGGLLTAVHMAKEGLKYVAHKTKNYQPIIVFLTDGAPNVGMSSTNEIVKTVTNMNCKTNKVPIFSLSFGNGADKEFLRKLSLKNLGFSRHIYEASDASLQLQQFYKQISSPSLSNIKFTYDSEVEEITKSVFPLYFKGSELVVSGKYKDKSPSTCVHCYGTKGPIILKSMNEKPVSSLERLWAFLTIKHLLDERDLQDNKEELINKAINIALKYSFVTEVTSLVVVKPNNEKDGINTEEDVTEPNERIAFGCCKKKAIKKRVIKKQKGDYEEVIEIPESLEWTEPIRKKPVKFLVNRPFMIMIILKKGDNIGILFKGRVLKPNNICSV